jgi:hypothetical protein
MDVKKLTESARANSVMMEGQALILEHTFPLVVEKHGMAIMRKVSNTSFLTRGVQCLAHLG